MRFYDDDDDDAMDDLLHLCFLLLFDDYKCKRACQRLHYRTEIGLAQWRRRQGKYRRKSLPSPRRSPWVGVYQSGLNDGLITLLGFDYRSFEILHQLFEPLYWAYTPYNREGCQIRRLTPGDKRRGNKRLFSSRACLGLVLAWTRTSGSLRNLQVLFGSTPNPTSLWLRFGKRLLLYLLKRHPYAMVSLPTAEERQQYKNAITAKYPLLVDVWGSMDGLKIPIEEPWGDELQGRFYNGWLHGHFLTNLFLFTPDGRIRMCVINAPGSMHDSQLAMQFGVYNTIDAFYEEDGSRVVGDSAFSGGKNRRSVIKSAATGRDRGAGLIPNTLVAQATSLRQSSEWGMRALQGSFPRLKDKFKWEVKGERRISISVIVHLYNFRAMLVGQNQIQTAFMPYLQSTNN
jgi:DDE superfamily endonuclease